MTKEDALVACWITDRDAKNSLKTLDCDVVIFKTSNQLLKNDYQQQPRLFVLEWVPDRADEVLKLVKQLRRERPITDVLVWAPHTSPVAVRDCFLAGTKDVLVTRSGRKLLNSISTILDEQQILPLINQMGRKKGKTTRFHSMLSRSAEMWDLFDLCTQIAPTDATVLIVGETGTGKELFARAIHRLSGRTGRFVPANCASTPGDLINSELFGYEKGAFTGADRSKAGLVRHAEMGTLFLDEIGDMDADAQQSLLRMLQEKKVRPVGALTESSVDVRVVAATNVPMEQAVAQGRFREDLFYRLDVIRINIPPLRNREEDILFLFGHFVKEFSKNYGLTPPTYTDSFLDAVLSFDWPGNVRQIQNFCERLILSRPQRALTPKDLKKLLVSSQTTANKRSASDFITTSPSTRIDVAKSLKENVEPIITQCEIAYLREVLKSNQGRIGKSASQADISRRTLLRKMKEYRLNRSDFQ